MTTFDSRQRRFEPRHPTPRPTRQRFPSAARMTQWLSNGASSMGREAGDAEHHDAGDLLPSAPWRRSLAEIPIFPQGASRTSGRANETAPSTAANVMGEQAPGTLSAGRGLGSAEMGAPAELHTGAIGPVLQRVASRQGQGQPLPPPLRHRFEQSFRVDLGAVRVHADPEAAAMANAAEALAFASGTDIYLASGAYQPGTATGEHLMAHEVAHVVEQAAGRAPPGVSRPGDAHELAADAAAHAAVAGHRAQRKAPAQVKPGVSQSLQRTVRFTGGMQKKINAQFMHFIRGLRQYLAIGVTYTLENEGQTAILTDPEIDVERQREITDLFSKNYDAYYAVPEPQLHRPKKTRDEAKADALSKWVTVRDAVLSYLKKKNVDVVEMTKARARGAEAVSTMIGPDEIQVNVKDYTKTTESDASVALSFNGFWRLTHEILHLALEIKADKDDDREPGPGKIEAYLNPLRIGFGLPQRTNYGSTDNMIQFEGGGHVIYPR
ncbi:DUF4157 domain-containing protein [Polyangium fumosum]|nr:DUF4157 domain-containing protein [Polyangium fumosum]